MNGGGKTTLLDAVQLAFYGIEGSFIPIVGDLAIGTICENQFTVAVTLRKVPALPYASGA